MKYLVIALLLVGFVACEKTDCQKATDDYNKFAMGLANAKVAYDTAKLAADQVCALFTKAGERAVDMGQACEMAKKAFQVAEVGFNAANVFANNSKAVMEASCATTPAAK